MIQARNVNPPYQVVSDLFFGFYVYARPKEVTIKVIKIYVYVFFCLNHLNN